VDQRHEGSEGIPVACVGIEVAGENLPIVWAVVDDLPLGIQHSFNPWFMWMSIVKSLFFAYIIASVSSYFGYTVEGGSVEVGKASTDAVVSSSVLILFSDVFLTQMLS